MGDFNIDLLKSNSHTDTSNFLEQNLSSCIRPFILRPTRITPHSKTLIDNIYSNYLEDNYLSGNIISAIPDHLPQFLLTGTSHDLPKTKPPRKITFKDYKNFDRQNLILDFIGTDWEEKFQNKSPEHKMSTLIEETNKIIDNNTPSKTIKNNRKHIKQDPWVTAGLLKSIITKDNLYKFYMKTKDKELSKTRFATFKKYKNTLTKTLRNSRTIYYKNMFSAYGRNSKLIWKGIRQIIGGKNKSSDLPNLFIHEGKSYNTDPNIANVFNDFYSTIAEKTKSKIIQTEKNFTDFLPRANPNSIFLDPTDPIEIFNSITRLNSSKSVGPESIPASLLKLLAPDISIILSKIINECLTEGTFPQCLKTAKIIPVHKKDSLLDPKNYRPISLLSNISKIFEKILHTRLYQFLERHNIIFKNQFGFRKQHNTTHACMALTEAIRNSLDNGEFAAGIFVDLQKAFDTVDHKILIQKLDGYGIRGTANKLLESYLENRKQFVEVRNSSSSLSSIKHGVPQGSVLGPLLFLIYINDLNQAIKHSKTFHFTDDSSLLYSNKSLKKLNSKVNHDLKHLSDWLRANKISLNAKKTEIILFKTKRKVVSKKLNFRLSGQQLELTKFTKYLGVIIDENLDWNMNINTLCKKLSNSVGIFAKLRHFLDYKTMLSLYYALFHSHITYHLPIAHLSHTNLTKIQNLQKKALRLIHFEKFNAPSLPIYLKSKILPIDKQVILQNCLFAHDQIKNNTPVYFHEFLQLLGDNHQFGTRRHRLAHTQTSTVTYGSNNLRNSITRNWNDTVNELTVDPLQVSKSTYKKHLKGYLLDSLV